MSSEFTFGDNSDKLSFFRKKRGRLGSGSYIWLKNGRRACFSNDVTRRLRSDTCVGAAQDGPTHASWFIDVRLGPFQFEVCVKIYIW